MDTAVHNQSEGAISPGPVFPHPRDGRSIGCCSMQDQGVMSSVLAECQTLVILTSTDKRSSFWTPVVPNRDPWPGI